MTRDPRSFGLLVAGWLVVGAFWVALVTLAAQTTEFDKLQSGTAAWLVGAAGFLGAIGWAQAGLIAIGLRVLGGPTWPRRLWRKWSRRALIQASPAWLVLAAAGSALLLLQPRHAGHWTAAPALMSLALAAGALAGLSAKRLLNGAWFWLVMAGPIVLMVSGELLERLAEFGRWPMSVHAALTLAWPITAFALARHLRALRLGTAPFRSPQKGWAGRARDWFRRYTPLAGTGASLAPDGSLRTPPWWSMLTNAWPGALACTTFWRGHWGEAAGPLHLLWLAFAFPICLQALTCRDLHWRLLLAPKGPLPNRLGWLILRSTLEILLPLFLAIAGFAALIDWKLAGSSAAQVLDHLIAFRVMPVEFLFLISLSVAVTSVQRTGVALMLAISVLVIAGGAYLFIWGPPPAAEPKWFRIDTPWLATLVIASAALIALANRAWTPQRLIQRVRPALARRQALAAADRKRQKVPG